MEDSIRQLKNETSPRVEKTCDSSCQIQLRSTVHDLMRLLRIYNGHITADSIRFEHVRFRAGQRIYRIGQEFDNLYVVRHGFLKTVLVSEWGDEQVLEFPISGDMLGVDGICSGHYGSDAIALGDCEVICVPFNRITRVCEAHPQLRTLVYEALSRELVREHRMIEVLVKLSAEQRVAFLLASLAERFGSAGLSATKFNLWMSRRDIGGYLNLSTETICRSLTSLQQKGVIALELRLVVIRDLKRLNEIRRLPGCIE